MHNLLKKIKQTTLNSTNITMKLKCKQKKYLDWGDYKNKIDFLDTLLWQQEIRKQNIKNL
ncbi:MAG: hypothetical protein ACLFN8_00010 [Candidatus Woesearchaeota archaeon]